MLSDLVVSMRVSGSATEGVYGARCPYINNNLKLCFTNLLQCCDVGLKMIILV